MSLASVAEGRELKLEFCPLCDEDLRGKKKTANHFLNDHLPEDFGLTPLGTVVPDRGGKA